MAQNRWISDMHWVRPGKQSRSQKTQDALLDAAELLFSEQGADATSVSDVAARAGFSVGAVYHHFRDKKALVYALFDRMTRELHANSKEATDPQRWEGASVEDILQSYLEFSLGFARNRPGFKQAGMEATRNDPALRAHMTELFEELHQGLLELLLARRSEIGHPRPKVAFSFVLDQFGAMLKTRNDVVVPTLMSAKSEGAFIREAMRSARAYLRIESAD